MSIRRNSHESDSEETPLLQQEIVAEPPSLTPRARQVAIMAMFTVVFLAMVGNSLVQVPMIRIIEDIICRNMLEGLPSEIPMPLGQIDEKYCKTDPIQVELAYIQGVSATLEAVPSLLLAFPYGLLADKIGRRPVAVLSLVGMQAALQFQFVVMWFSYIFPIRLLWAGVIFMVIGGGNSVLISMLYTILTDVTTIENRSNVFFVTSALAMGGDLIGTTLGARLMKPNPWVPVFIGQALMISSGFFFFATPETLKKKPQIESNEQQHEEAPSLSHHIKQARRHVYAEVQELGHIMRSVPVAMLAFIFFAHGLLVRAVIFMIQYMSQRFKLSLSSSGYISSMRCVVNIVLLLVLLPLISRFLTGPRIGLSSARKDLLTARGSVVLLALGAFLIASPFSGVAITGIIIYTLGNGMISMCRSLLATLVDQQHMARLYSLLSVLDALGTMVSGPMLSGLFSLGLKMKGEWAGLPYLGISVICILCFIALAFVKVEEKTVKIGDEVFIEETVENAVNV